MRGSSLCIHKLWSAFNKRSTCEPKLQQRIPRPNGNVFPKTKSTILQNGIGRRHLPSPRLPNRRHSRINRGGALSLLLHFVLIPSRYPLHPSATARWPKMALFLANGGQTKRRPDSRSTQNNTKWFCGLWENHELVGPVYDQCG